MSDFYSLKPQRTAQDIANRRQRSAVTPSPKHPAQGNRYNALETDDTDEEGSNRSNNNNNSNASDISAASSIDSDYSDIFEVNMNSTPTDTVLESLEPIDRLPIPTPNINDVQRIRSRIANVLFDKPGEEDTNHAGLVETLAGHRDRLQDQRASLPKPPKDPANRPPITNKVDLLIWQMDKGQRNAWDHYNRSALIAIKVVFPNGLTDLELSHAGALPIFLTARQAFDHIEKKTKTDDISTTAYSDALKRMQALKYTPNGNGPTDYFKAMVTAQFEANSLDRHGKVSDGQIIMYAKNAFSNCGHAAIHLTDVSTKWNNADEKYETDHPNTFLETRWNRFCVLYSAELIKLVNSTVIVPDHQAHHSQEFENRIRSVEIGNEQAHSNIDRLHSNMQSLDDSRSVPGDIITSGSTNGTVATAATPVTAQDVASIMATALQAYETNQNNDGNRGRNRGGDRGGDRRGRGREYTKSTEWRQWNKWCWECGVNLKHNSEGHWSKASNHKDAATRTTPLGGNSKRDHLWMKWWSPHDK